MEKDNTKQTTKRKPKATKKTNDPVVPFLFSFNKEMPKEEENGKTVREELELKIIDEIYSKEDIEIKTDINKRQVQAYAIGDIFAENFDVPVVSKLVKKLSIYAVSDGRKSRKEFENIAKSIGSMEEQESNPRVRDRLLGNI